MENTQLITIGSIQEKLPKKVNMLVSNIKMKDGTNTQILTLFENHKIGFEEIEIGVIKGLEFLSEVDTVQDELYSIRNGNIYESGIRFAKKKNNYRYATHRD